MPTRPKVLMVHASDELYGSDRVLLDLARSLSASFDILVLVPNDLPYQGLLWAELAKAGIRCQRARLAVLRRRYLTPVGVVHYLVTLLLSAWAIARLIRAERVSLVHSNTLAVLAGALASRLTRRKHVWQVHEIVTHPRALSLLLARLLYFGADTVVAVSAATHDHLVAAYPPNRRKTIVIPNGIDAAEFQTDANRDAVRAELGFLPSDIVIGMVGRIHAGKGQEVFLAAASTVRQMVPHARFLVIGDAAPGDEARVADLACQVASLDLERHVVLTGFRRDIPRLLQAVDVYVLPSTHPEAFGRGVVEAMACGLPVVATAHGGPREIVVDEVTGLLVPPGDVDALADAMLRLARSPQTRQAMGEAGRARAATVFSLARQAEQVRTVYLEWLDPR